MAFLCVECTGWSPKASVLHPASLIASYINAIDFNSSEYDIHNWCSLLLINSIRVISMYDNNTMHQFFHSINLYRTLRGQARSKGKRALSTVLY